MGRQFPYFLDIDWQEDEHSTGQKVTKSLRPGLRQGILAWALRCGTDLPFSEEGVGGLDV